MKIMILWLSGLVGCYFLTINPPNIPPCDLTPPAGIQLKGKKVYGEYDNLVRYLTLVYEKCYPQTIHHFRLMDDYVRFGILS